MNAPNRNGQLAADQKMIDGVAKYLSKFTSLPVGSQQVTPAEMIKVFQDRIDAAKAAVTAEAARSAAVKVSRDTRKQTAAFVLSLRRMVQGMFSQSPDTLAEFGLKPIKAAKTKVATKATALAKSTATRKARNTMGSKQRKGVKGTASPSTSGMTPTTPPAKSNA
ncbi:MAG: hypothetical protein M3O36_02475 [Myxococcota bacterium]|nr:hypothetical protein [Myxococcota bacterium]